MILAMSITNFGIYVALLWGYEYYLKKRRNRSDVFFLASEERWYKILMLILGISIFAMDIAFKEASYFVYTVLFLSYTFTLKEIGEKGIINNLRRVKLKDISTIEMKEKTHGYHVYYQVKNRTFEMVVRKSLATHLEGAVSKVQKIIDLKE